MELPAAEQHSMTLKEEYEETLQHLRDLCDDLLQKERTKDAIFIRDIILRLKAWGSNIGIEENNLKPVEKVALLAAQIRVILHDLKVQSDSVHKPSGSGEFDAKTDCKQSMDNLNSLSESIRTVNNPSRSEAEATVTDRINDRLKTLSFRQYPRNATWILLPQPISAAKQDKLLGGVIVDPFDPLKDFVEIDASKTRRPIGQVGECEFTLSRSSSSSLSLGIQLSGVLGFNIFTRARESTYTIKAPEVKTATIDNDEAIFLQLNADQKKSIIDLMARHKKRKVYLVAGVMVATRLERKTKRTQSVGALSQELSFRRGLFEKPVSGSDPALPGPTSKGEDSSETSQIGLNVIFALKYRIVKIKKFSFSRKLSVGSYVEASELDNRIRQL